MRYCQNCGLLQAPDATHCPQCGAALPPEPPAPAPEAPRYTGPEGTAPGELSFAATLGALLLFAIPVVGFVMTLVWGFGGSRHPGRQRLAQAYLVRTLIVAVLVALVMLLFAFMAYFTITPVRVYY